MIAYVDVSLAGNNVFAAYHFITDKGEHTKHPAPRFHKKISNSYSMLAKECRNNYARQKQQHEYGKHQKHPKDV